MRTSLNEIKHIENFLLRRTSIEEALLLEAKLALDQEFRQKLVCQQQAYQTIKADGREEIYREIEAVHQKLFTNPVHSNFKQKILGIFKKGRNL